MSMIGCDIMSHGGATSCRTHTLFAIGKIHTSQVIMFCFSATTGTQLKYQTCERKDGNHERVQTGHSFPRQQRNTRTAAGGWICAGLADHITGTGTTRWSRFQPDYRATWRLDARRKQSLILLCAAFPSSAEQPGGGYAISHSAAHAYVTGHNGRLAEKAAALSRQKTMVISMRELPFLF